MTVFRALIEGMGMATRHWRALLLIYILNLLLAATVALPVASEIDSALSRTESAERMAEGFDWLWHQGFRSEHPADSDLPGSIGPRQEGLKPVLRNFEAYVRGASFPELPPGLFVLGVIYLLFNTLLIGGILGLFADDSARFTFRFFFDRAGRFFAILVGILIAAYLLYWFLWGVLGPLHAGLVGDLRASARSEWTPLLADWAGIAILIFLAFFVHMTMDYARVAAAAWDRLGLFPAVFGAFGFVLRQRGRVLGLFYLTTLLAAVIAILFSLLVKLGGGAGPAQLITLFVVQQAFIIASIWIRMVYLGSQMAFYRGTLNMPRWVTPAGPPPDELEDEVIVEEAAVI